MKLAADCGGGTTDTDAPKDPTPAPTAMPTPAPTEPPSQEPTRDPSACNDYTLADGSAWHDAAGDDYDCDYYSKDNHCEEYGDKYEYDGYTANQACCNCAGGTTGTDTPTEAPTITPTAYTESPTDAPTEAPTTASGQECEDYTLTDVM